MVPLCIAFIPSRHTRCVTARGELRVRVVIVETERHRSRAVTMLDRRDDETVRREVRTKRRVRRPKEIIII